MENVKLIKRSHMNYVFLREFFLEFVVNVVIVLVMVHVQLKLVVDYDDDHVVVEVMIVDVV